MISAIRLPRLLQRPLLDVKLGFALMRDRRVPLRSKLVALLLGLGVTAFVEFLEIPVEGLLSMLLPVLGAMGDFVIDGAELVAGPVFLAAALLPFVAPRPVVDQIRTERAGSVDGAKSKIIDV